MRFKWLKIQICKRPPDSTTVEVCVKRFFHWRFSSGIVLLIQFWTRCITFISSWNNDCTTPFMTDIAKVLLRFNSTNVTIINNVLCLVEKCSYRWSTKERLTVFNNIFRLLKTSKCLFRDFSIGILGLMYRTVLIPLPPSNAWLEGSRS